MWPEIKDSEPGQEKFSVSGLEMEEVAIGPRTTSENYSQVEQGSRGGGVLQLSPAAVFSVPETRRTEHLLPLVDPPFVTHSVTI